MSRAVIFVNGLVPEINALRRILRPEDALLATDGGTRHALALGLLPALIVGDLDSLAETDRRRAVEKGVRLVQHPRDKDETDFELVLTTALQQGHGEILVVGALGGRLDQTLGNLALLADPRLEGVDIHCDDGLEEAFFVRSRSLLHGAAGELVSLLPWGVEVTGVTTEGLRWPLRADTLHPCRTRGISNEMLGEDAAVSIASGLLLIVHRRRN